MHCAPKAAAEGLAIGGTRKTGYRTRQDAFRRVLLAWCDILAVFFGLIRPPYVANWLIFECSKPLATYRQTPYMGVWLNEAVNLVTLRGLFLGFLAVYVAKHAKRSWIIELNTY